MVSCCADLLSRMHTCDKRVTNWINSQLCLRERKWTWDQFFLFAWISHIDHEAKLKTSVICAWIVVLAKRWVETTPFILWCTVGNTRILNGGEHSRVHTSMSLWTKELKKFIVWVTCMKFGQIIVWDTHVKFEQIQPKSTDSILALFLKTILLLLFCLMT